MDLFQKKMGPVFLKEDSDASIFINKMRELEKQVSDVELKNEIEKQIKLAVYGELGERNISFELKNSGMDMCVLHDIYLEFGDLSAQIDYLVITRKYIFVLECKNLIGDIEIDNQGNFIRSYEFSGKRYKEGIYSPITQNTRHLEVLKQVRMSAKNNFITKAFFEHYFNDNYKSLVVLANPKTILNAKYAKKEIKEQVIRVDQLNATIKRMCDSCKEESNSNKDMFEYAQFFLNANRSERSDYARKYEEALARVNDIPVVSNVINNVIVQNEPEKNSIKKDCPKCGKELVLRTAKKGNNAGNKFYGCSGYPNCRYIENIYN